MITKEQIDEWKRIVYEEPISWEEFTIRIETFRHIIPIILDEYEHLIRIIDNENKS